MVGVMGLWIRNIEIKADIQTAHGYYLDVQTSRRYYPAVNYP